MWIGAGIVLILVAFGAYRSIFHAVPVQVVEVRSGTVEDELHGPGTVQARIPVTVSTRITGVVAALYVDQGDAVRAGQLLARLDDRDVVARQASAHYALAAAKQNVTAAEAALAKAQSDNELARENYRRDVALFKEGIIPEAAMDAARATLRSAEAGERSATSALAARRSDASNAAQELRYAEVQRSYAEITAPMDGTIIDRNAEVGDTVVPGSPMFLMLNPRTLWVVTRIDESVVDRAAVGQPARIRLRAGGEVAGKVARIEHQSDSATRELEVDVAFDSPPRAFAVNQEAEVTIVAARSTGAVVPASALVTRGGRRGVMVVRHGRTLFVPVRTGVFQGSWVIVKEGLRQGNLVVTQPQNVRPGERVRPVMGKS